MTEDHIHDGNNFDQLIYSHAFEPNVLGIYVLSYELGNKYTKNGPKALEAGVLILFGDMW